MIDRPGSDSFHQKYQPSILINSQEIPVSKPQLNSDRQTDRFQIKI